MLAVSPFSNPQEKLFVSPNRRGILAIVSGTAAFSANDTIVKIVAREYPLGEVLAVRGIMTTALVGTILLSLGHFTHLPLAVNRLVLMRSVLEALAALTFTSALLHMRLADLSTIIMISPLVITAFAVLFLRETVGWRRWTAISVGFVGALFIIKPTPAAFDAWALLGVLCACISATRDLLTRRLPHGIPSIIVSFMSALAVTIAGFLLGFWEEWRPLGSREIGLLAIGAGFLAAGNFLVVLAFRGVDMAAVAPFRYAILLWASILGFTVFGEIPDRWSAVGALFIVGSGVYAIHRERVRGREIASGASPSQ